MSLSKNNKVIIFSAPSGSGKTTIVQHLLGKFPNLYFSISATTRLPRGSEAHGKEYYFLSPDEFRQKIAGNELVEWEEVYTDRYYGTLKSELERIWNTGGIVLFDVDVKGGINIKKLFGDNALSIFVMPPSIEELRRRLESRNTDSAEDICSRVQKAEEELRYAEQFDKVIINHTLPEAIAETEQVVEDWITK